MKTRVSIRGALFAVAAMLMALCFAPSAFARVHVGVGISVPGISIGVGNCLRCGYYAPPVPYAPYYPPAYAAPVYYPAPVYYAPRPVYYGYGPGYYAPSYYVAPRRSYYRTRYHHRGWQHGHAGYYHHGHR